MSLPATACHASFTSGFRSSATNTAYTPGRASAAAVSMRLIRALANGTPNETRVQHARPRDVVDERSVAGEQASVLDAGDPRARISGCDGLIC